MIAREVSEILERIGATADIWRARLEALRRGRLLGRFFAATRARLREVAHGLGLGGRPTWVGARRLDAGRDAPITSRSCFRRRLPAQEESPGIVAISAESEELPQDSALWNVWVVPCSSWKPIQQRSEGPGKDCSGQSACPRARSHSHHVIELILLLMRSIA
jgi:hypothetical protein